MKRYRLVWCVIGLLFLVTFGDILSRELTVKAAHDFTQARVIAHRGYGNPENSLKAYQSAYDPNCAALYNPNLNFTFEKGASAWDNPYAAPAPIMQPIINWNAPNMPQPSVMPPSCPAYQQVYNFPQTNLNWNDIAEKNWGKTIL